MRMPRNFRWAAQRTREVWLDEGLKGIRVRGQGYVRQRLSGVDSSHRLPRGTSGPTSWPTSVVMVAASFPEQCFHYRVQQKREACALLGIPFHLVEPESPGIVADAVQLASVVIIFRLGTDPATLTAIHEARRLGIPVIFETDDAVYRRDLLEGDPNLRLVAPSLRRSVIKGADQYRAVAQMADHVLASTEPLAADLGKLVSGRAFVIDNGIDADMRAVAAGLPQDPAPPARVPGTIRIGYGSGSRAHDYDLALAAPGLRHVLSAHPEVELYLMGPVEIPEILKPLRHRINQVPGMNYAEYLRQLASCDISIAPLADFTFNTFKSQVKYMESGLLGVPFVASRTVYHRYVSDGLTGVLVDADEWGPALSRAVTDPELRRRLAAGARTDVARFEIDHMPARQMASMLEALT